MRAINHAVTGAVLAVAIDKPIIVVPLALLSHFALDALPHFGQAHEDHRSSGFLMFLLTDIALCGVLVLALLLARPDAWLLPALCAFLATSADFMWMPGYLRTLHGLPQRKSNSAVIRFHSWVQWYQRPPGAITEGVWLFGGILLLVRLLT
jgi:hypothetical protein